MDLASYRNEDGIGIVAMDDGKANAISLPMLAALGAAFDAAEADDVGVVLEGRDGRFSAGFDLNTLGAGGPDAMAMLMGGFELAVRLLTFPRPIVVACTGHAFAMGAFLLASGDHRVGADGPFTVTANEVAIGLTMPYTPVEICRLRLAPAHFHRAVVLAERYDPAGAVAAGWLDEVVATDDVRARAREVAQRLAALDIKSLRNTRERAHGDQLERVRQALARDRAELT